MKKIPYYGCLVALTYRKSYKEHTTSALTNYCSAAEWLMRNVLELLLAVLKFRGSRGKYWAFFTFMSVCIMSYNIQILFAHKTGAPVFVLILSALKCRQNADRKYRHDSKKRRKLQPHLEGMAVPFKNP